MSILTSVGLLGIVLLSMVACNQVDGPELLANPHFPQLREDGDVMDADLEGELVLENGCLRSKKEDGTDYLLIWPKRFKLTVDGRDIRISDDSGASLSVGAEIRIGGGEVPLAHVQTLVEQPVPDDCPGPYWVVGEVPIPTGAQESSGPVAQIQQQPTPTSTLSPRLPGSITPVPASERNRLDLGDGVVVAFVEGLSPKSSDKAAYLTHVPSGSQIVLDRDGRVIERHGDRDNGLDRLDAVLADQATVDRIVEGLKSEVEVRPRQVDILWTDSIWFGGITYRAKGSLAGPINLEEDRILTVEDLGPELYRVAFRAAGYAGSNYRIQDGDATLLRPGTPVYAVKGYDPEFRLATLGGRSVRVFEADMNPAAKIGEDLLDIRGKVTTIDINSGEDARTVGGSIDEERAVERFVEMVLESPVGDVKHDHEGPRFFLAFHLADGTSVVRAFWLESGELARDIMTDPAVTFSVWRALGEEHRPVSTDGGPRISERLAARLGLAYLSFAMPEVVVTAKPHSPVVRLMRRSEFQAMQGSSSALDSDPLVWVVEAQGSWRTAGIVPEEKRQDLSVGLVAFDADTARRYGASHVNTSLLGTPGGSQPSTPPPSKPTLSPPPNIPEPRSSQDTVSSEEREEVKARRGPPPWGPHTAGSVIQIAGKRPAIGAGLSPNGQ